MVSDPDADQWDVVMMPAIALEEEQYPRTHEEFIENLLRGVFIPMNGDQLGRKPGETLWPDKHNNLQLKALSTNMEDFEFAAQFQQMPRLSKGNFFDENDFKIVEKAPDGLRWFRYSDLALGKTKTSDFNACYAGAMNSKGDLFIRDPIKERNLDEFLSLVKVAMLSEQETGTRWGFEDVAFQHLVFKQMLEDKRLAKIAIESVIPVGSKEDRAFTWRGRAKAGKVYLVRGTWNLDFLRVASAFGPSARYDDDIDSVSGDVQMISEDATGENRTASSQAVVVDAEQLFEAAISS
jgi:predicted phage terminase large subunit-like protein